MTGRPVTAAALMSERPLWVDYPCQAWSGVTVRLAKISPAKYVQLAEVYESYERDEAGKVSREDRYDWAVAVVAAHVVDGSMTVQFASVEAQQWLASEPGAVSELLVQAMQLSGLGTVEVEDAGGAGGEKKSP